jgi:hypothetical protein
MKFGLSVFVALILSTNFFSSPIIAAEKASLWTGRYRDAKRGDYDLVIDEWEPGQLQVDIVKAGKTSAHDEDVQAGFLADVKGNIATWSSISECPISLKRTQGGIEVTDDCKGARDSTGFYRPVHP